MRPLVVVGDSLLDRDLDGPVERVAPDAPVPVVRSPATVSRPGGAALAAALLASSGRPVVLVTALAADAAGGELVRLLERSGVETIAARLHGGTPEKVRVRGNGHLLLRLDPADGPCSPGDLPRVAQRAIAGAGAVLVSDYGKGMAAAADVRGALVAARGRVPVVWDPHPRGAAPVEGLRAVTPNRVEAARLAGGGGGADLQAAADDARRLLERWRCGGVAVTLGQRGALLVTPGAHPLVAPPPAPVPASADPCGAGDRFAAEVAALLAAGGLLSDAVVGAVAAASAFISGGGVATLERGHAPTPTTAGNGRPGAEGLARRVRSAGGTVVATGGCFDLLHAGHVDLLRSARALGDCLVVCLNSDASVRRLKGPDRPLVGQEDRAAVLAALDAVDGIALFDEDTPERLLRRLRPHVWVKGADYAAGDLPEAATLAAWGGQAVVLPYRPGHSTSGLIEEIRTRTART